MRKGRSRARRETYRVPEEGKMRRDSLRTIRRIRLNNTMKVFSIVHSVAEWQAFLPALFLEAFMKNWCSFFKYLVHSPVRHGISFVVGYFCLLI
jgi:hypothetical protein